MYRFLDRKNVRLFEIRVLFASLLAAALSLAGLYQQQPAYATTFITWDGGGDGSSFSDPLNWDTDTVPTPGPDDGIIIVSGAVVHLDIDITLEGDAHITNNGGTLEIDAGKTLTISNSVMHGTGVNNLGIMINHGTIAIGNINGLNWGIGNFGPLDNYGEITIEHGGTGILNSNEGPGIINNFGTMTARPAGPGAEGIHNLGIINNPGSITLANPSQGSRGILNEGTVTSSGTITIQSIGSIQPSPTVGIHN